MNVSVLPSAITFDRAKGRFVQTITIANNGANLTAVAYVLDALSAGAVLVAPTGFTAVTAPAGSPYRELGPMAPGASVTLALEFTRLGVVPIAYVPRVLGPGPR